MEGLANALERRDAYTYRHSIRVTEHVRTILGAMPQIPRPTAEAIIAAAHVHDLGKVGSRDGSLKKPGELSAEERQEIEQHAAIGAEIVSRLEAYKQSVDTIRHHHERWDGTGYPDGLEGEQIPLGARIIAVADAFDAMTSDRVYRAALPVDVAFAELAKGRGTQFDPQIVDVFAEGTSEPFGRCGAAIELRFFAGRAWGNKAQPGKTTCSSSCCETPPNVVDAPTLLLHRRLNCHHRKLRSSRFLTWRPG